jgi:hypothetical protein
VRARRRGLAFRVLGKITRRSGHICASCRAWPLKKPSTRSNRLTAVRRGLTCHGQARCRTTTARWIHRSRARGPHGPTKLKVRPGRLDQGCGTTARGAPVGRAVHSARKRPGSASIVATTPAPARDWQDCRYPSGPAQAVERAAVPQRSAPLIDSDDHHLVGGWVSRTESTRRWPTDVHEQRQGVRRQLAGTICLRCSPQAVRVHLTRLATAAPRGHGLLALRWPLGRNMARWALPSQVATS